MMTIVSHQCILNWQGKKDYAVFLNFFKCFLRMRGETYGAAVHVDVHVYETINDTIRLTDDIIQGGLDRRRKTPVICKSFVLKFIIFY